MNDHKAGAVVFKALGITSIAIGGVVGTFLGAQQTRYLEYIKASERWPDIYPMTEAPMKYDIATGISVFVLAAFIGLVLFGIGCLIHVQSDLLAVAKNAQKQGMPHTRQVPQFASPAYTVQNNSQPQVTEEHIV